MIDLADLLDKVSGIIVANNKCIDKSSKTVKDIKNFLHDKQPSDI